MILEKSCNPDYKPMLLDYLNGTERPSYGKHTAHLMTEALGWHNRCLRSGSMRVREEKLKVAGWSWCSDG